MAGRQPRQDASTSCSTSRVGWLPRGVTSAGAAPCTTVEGAGLPWVGPVGRLDQASEGLLLFSNDSAWAAGVTAPGGGLRKRYHVQIDRIPDEPLLLRLRAGIEDRGELLSARAVDVLRQGTRTAWLEIVLVEGRNRQIRRMLAACGVEVLRLVRVAIGPL